MSEKILNALEEFGFKSLKLTKNDFTKEGTIIQLGYEPLRIDIITSIKGIDFNAIWKNKKIHKKNHIKSLKEIYCLI
jgi:hypothetical protein